MSALHRNSAYLGWTQGPGTRSRRVPDVDSKCRLLIVPPFRGSSRFESLILSHHSRTKLHVSVMNEVKAEPKPLYIVYPPVRYTPRAGPTMWILWVCGFWVLGILPLKFDPPPPIYSWKFDHSPKFAPKQITTSPKFTPKIWPPAKNYPQNLTPSPKWAPPQLIFFSPEISGTLWETNVSQLHSEATYYGDENFSRLFYYSLKQHL